MQTFNNWSVRAKIAVALGVVLAFVIALGTQSLRSMMASHAALAGPLARAA